MKRRVLVHAIAATAVLLVGQAQAQSYPNKPIRMVVPFAAGGGTDAVGRVLAPRLSELLGQQLVIDNRAGANGAIGTAEVKRAAPDGYTVLLGAAGTMVVAPNLDAKLPFDTDKDFVPIALAATSPFVVAVGASVPVNDIAQLIALAKAQPGKINYGSSGTGGAPHLAGELFKRMAGVDLTHVPYRGLAPAMTDLLGGQIQLLFVDVSIAMPQVKAGKIKALAITSAQRSPVAPELPTVAEAGVAGYAAGTWYGVFVPAGTPEPVVRRLTSDTTRALESTEVRERLIALGAEAAPLSGESFRIYVRQELAKWGQLVRDANIKLE